MKIAFVGKGGSGKSSVSWLVTRTLLAQKRGVLAVDTDYNMDLAHNLGWDESNKTNFINDSEEDFYAYVGLDATQPYRAIMNLQDLPSFSLDPKDRFSQKYAPEWSDKLSLMVSGGTHEELLYGHRCGHAYMAPVKFYLPLLNLSADQAVVVDSVAGTDMVAYGLYTGVDAVVVVVEPTRHSRGVYEQISSITREFGIPTYGVANKVTLESDMTQLAGIELLGAIPSDVHLVNHDYEKLAESTVLAANKLVKKLGAVTKNASEAWPRFERWLDKYEEQKEKVEQDSFKKHR
jgi:CO dehydrogenase maturation factor